MKPQNTAAPPVDTLQQEHDDLEAEVQEWRKWWGELSQLGQPHFGEMANRLSKFRDHLSAHFQHEEFQGPLAQEPGADVASLWREHAHLLAELDRHIERLRTCGPNAGCWGGARDEFEAFLNHLSRHEEHEKDILVGLHL